MRTLSLILVVALLAGSLVFAEEDPEFKTSLSFQPGVILMKDHTEPYQTLGFDTNMDPFYLWTGFGYTIKVNQADESATAAYYPWLTTVVGFSLWANDSGDCFLRPQLTVSWSTLSYQFPGIGLNGQWTMPVAWSDKGPTGFVFQAEINYFPPVWDNPWYDRAIAAGVDVGSKYWKLTYGGMVKYYFRSYHIDFEARFAADNYSYDIDGRYSKIINADYYVTLGMKGLSLRGGITTNGWNYSRDGGSLVPDLMPNFSIILYH